MILVLGASGTNGNALVERLSALGADTRAGHRDASRFPALPHVERVRADYDDADSIRRALDGVERVFVVSPSSPRLAEREGAVADEAKRAGVKHFVLVSTSRAEHEDYLFGRWHRASEKRVEASGVPWTFLRPSAYMQATIPLFAASIRAKSAMYLPAQNARVAHVDVRDVASVAARVLTTHGHEGRAYHLTGPSALTYTELAQIFSEVLGRRIEYTSPREESYRDAMLKNGTPAAVADAMAELCRYYVEGKAAGVSSEVAEILRRPPTSFVSFLRDYASSFV